MADTIKNGIVQGQKKKAIEFGTVVSGSGGVKYGIQNPKSDYDNQGDLVGDKPAKINSGSKITIQHGIQPAPKSDFWSPGGKEGGE